MKLSKEFKTGVVFLIAIGLLYWGFNFMKGKNVFSGSIPTYYTEYSDVQGLNLASKVTINGLQVGKVQEIVFNTDPDKIGSLIVSYTMEADFDFSKNSIAKIYSDGLMGGKALAIVPSYKGEKAISGDFLRGEIESDMLSSFGEKLNPLQAKIEDIIVSADTLLIGLNDILDTPTRNSLKNSIVEFNKSMANLTKLTHSFDVIVADNKENLASTLDNAKQVTGKFNAFTDNLNTELQDAKIAATVLELKATIAGINAVVADLDAGKGSLGKLLKDEKLYVNLEKASKELEELLRDVKENPTRYVQVSVFGKKDKTGYKKSDE